MYKKLLYWVGIVILFGSFIPKQKECSIAFAVNPPSIKAHRGERYTLIGLAYQRKNMQRFDARFEILNDTKVDVTAAEVLKITKIVDDGTRIDTLKYIEQKFNVVIPKEISSGKHTFHIKIAGELSMDNEEYMIREGMDQINVIIE